MDTAVALGLLAAPFLFIAGVVAFLIVSIGKDQHRSAK